MALSRNFRRDLDTYSNVAYLLAAGALYMLGNPTPATFVLILTMLYLAVGSGAHHYKYQQDPQMANLDVSAMYAVFGGMLAYSLTTAFEVVEGYGEGVVILVAAMAGAYVLRYRAPGNMRLKIGILLGSTLAIILTRAFYWGQAIALVPLGIAVVLFGVALYVRDKENTPRFPGHALWHLLTGAGLPFLYLAIR